MNRAHVWNSDAIWFQKPTANDTFYIGNALENKVLGVVEDNVELVGKRTDKQRGVLHTHTIIL